MSSDDTPSRTRISVGLEEGADEHYWAHGLSLPGCAAPGSSPLDAVEAFQGELMEWLRFLASAGEPVPPPDAEVVIEVDEWLETEAHAGRGESVACFADDLRVLTEDETRRGIRLLGDLRGTVLARIRRVPRNEIDAALDAPTEGGWTVRQVLEELARAQWLTLSGLGASPMAGAPNVTLARLDTALALVVQHLGHLEPERRGLRFEMDGEEWTPRKVLRRLLWLEWTLGRTAGRALDAAMTTGSA